MVNVNFFPRKGEAMRKAVLFILFAATVALVFTGCESVYLTWYDTIKPPVVSLERVEVASYQPFHILPRIGFKDCKNPGKVGKYGYSSIINLAYIFKIYNPNKFAVKLDEIRFITAFEGFDVNMPIAYEDQWIPGQKTNQLRVIATNEAFQTMVSLMVGAVAANRIKKMGTKPAALVKKWWENIGDFSFPIQIKNGVATFERADGKTVMSTFTAVFPPKG